MTSPTSRLHPSFLRTGQFASARVSKQRQEDYLGLRLVAGGPEHVSLVAGDTAEEDENDDLPQGVWFDAQRAGGIACIRGHRIHVSLALSFLARGSTVDELVDMYPGTARADVFACLEYAAWLARRDDAARRADAANARNDSH